MTVCLFCGWTSRDDDWREHFVDGLCRRRQPVPAGELVEGKDGRFRIVKGKP